MQKIGAPRAEQILHQVLFLWGLFFSALRAAVEEGPKEEDANFLLSSTVEYEEI